MGGSFEGSEEGVRATIALYNNWVSSLGNPTNVYEANSREANENLLLDTYMLVLTDRKNVTETRLPLDKVTGIIKDEILPIVDGSATSSEIVPFNEMSPTFLMNKKYEYSGGKTGIGPFALNNKNHVLTQLTNLMFKDDDVLKSLGFTGLNGIKSLNEQIHKRDEDGNYEYDENGLPIYENEEGLNILDWISAMINAHVDVAKDPYVIRLNVRQYTYNICNFLLRAGFGKNTFYFLPQPILKEMALAYERANGIYGVKGGSKTSIVNAEIQKIRRRYYRLYADACAKSGVPIELDMRDNGKLIERTKIKMEEYAPTIMGRDYLIDSLQDGQSINNANADVQAKYYRDQLRYSELFLYLNDLAQDMSKLVQLSQIDTKRYGGNFVEQDRFMYRLKSFLTTTRLFKREDVENYFANTFLLTKAINGMVMPASIFLDVMFRSKQTFKNAVSKVLTLINRDTVNDPDLNKTISNELEGQLRWLFLSTLPNFDLFDMMYGDKKKGTISMSQRLANIKRDIIAGKYPEMKTVDGKIANKLLNHLTSLARFSTDDYNAPSIIATNSLDESDKFLKQDLKLYWEELLESPHDEIRLFATDLIYYELATTGGNFTKNGMWNILPVSAILNSGYATFIDNAVLNFTEADINYNELFLNNWTNGKIVPAIETTRLAFDEEVGENYELEIFPILHGNIKINGISTRIPVILNPYRATVGKNSNNLPLYTPYVKVIVNRNTPEGTLLYKYVGIIKDNKDKERPIYVLTNKKGLNQGGRVVKEYDGYSNSIFDFNNIEKSLFGNAPVTPQAVLDVINNLGDKDERGEWVQRIQDTFKAVNDFLPSTQAMNTDLLTLGLNIGQNDNTTPVVTPESVDQGDTIQPEEAEDNIFTFRDGTLIQIPFKLNDQQTKALLVLEDFIKNPKKYNNVITLSGYAGTGKSTLIGIFDKYLQTKFITPNYSAPTHRANAVTLMNNPNAVVRTLHSLFGLSPLVDLTDGNYDLRQLKNVQRNKPQLKDNAVLIIDEASMISKGLFKFIEEYKNNHNVKIIYVGDDAQLSPVNDDSISPVFTGNQTKLQLTKVERTGDNAILAESTRLRNGEDFSYETRDNVEFTNSQDRANEVIDTVVNSEEFKTNPLYFRILSATNDMISDANNRVRRILFGDNAKLIEVGDIMMGYNNVLNPTEQGDRLISNSIDYVVTEVGEKETNTVGKVKVSGWHVTLEEANAAENNKQIKRIFVLDNNISDENLLKLSDHYKSINTAISQAFADHNYNLIDGLQQEKSWFEANTVLMRDYVGTGNRLLLRKSLDYGYAHTIHKSLGGTYNNVLIYADTINRFNDPLVRQQLKYVAMSRAKDNVTVLTSHPTTGSRPQSTSIAEEWSRKEGWSVDYFNNKVLPKLNLAWQIEYKVADNQNIDDSNIKVAQSNFDYGNNKRTEVTADNTLQAIKNGERTSTTRYEDDKHIDFWKQFKVGDYIKFVKKDANGNIIDSVIVEITKPATKLVEQTTQVPESVQQESVNPKDFRLYSGGATGSDTKWAEIANKYDIGKTVSYRPEHLDLLTPAQTQEVETAYIGAANKLGRKQLDANTIAGKLVRRDYLQAKAADSIFAVGHILRPGEKNAKGYTVRSTIPSVDGGTGYAVQMGIDLHKPVHVYDLVYDQWYRFDYDDNTFVAEDIPTLTPKFAGIGTREINDKGINAIEQVFLKTFGSIQTQTEQPNTINIWYSLQENADLSNFAHRPFNYKGYDFFSVEQGFLFAKLGYATDSRDNEIIGNKIMLDKSGSQLRKLGKSIQGLNTKEWDANKYRIMKDMIKASFELNPKAKQRLLSTGDAVLTHNQERSEWKTKFPELLMEVRSELGQPVQLVQEQQQPAKPFDLTNFATFDESELQSDPDIQELNNKGEQIKNDCKGN